MVAPVFHKKLYAEVPPEGEDFDVPLFAEAEDSLVDVTFAERIAGAAIVACPVPVWPFALVAVTVKVPAARFWIVAVVDPFDH